MKFLKFSFVFIIIFSLCSLSCFALSATTYADLSPTASHVQNLISSAMNYSDFLDSDYVVFQDSQYSYRICWAKELNYNGRVISSDDVQSISYVRNGSGYDYTWSYSYDDSDSFNLTVNHLVISNIDGVGAFSPTYDDYKYHHNSHWLLIFSLSFLGVLMFLAFRRTFR